MKGQIEFGRQVVLGLLNSLKGAEINPDNNAQVQAMALHATIVELFDSCLAMAERNATAGIPVVLRSIYEALVDLDNLLTSADYVKHMEAANLEQICKLLDQAGANPLFEGLSERVDAPSKLAEYRQRLSDLKAEGIEALRFSTRCKRVGRENEYRTMYGLFCLDSHNNMAALADRHLDEQDGKVQVNFFAEPHLPSIRQRLSFGTGFLLQSAHMIHSAFQTGQIGAIVSLEQEYEERRRRLAAAASAAS
jgi:hypothetical protein